VVAHAHARPGAELPQDLILAGPRVLPVLEPALGHPLLGRVPDARVAVQEPLVRVDADAAGDPLVAAEARRLVLWRDARQRRARGPQAKGLVDDGAEVGEAAESGGGLG
jgi:hypothetical protein